MLINQSINVSQFLVAHCVSVGQKISALDVQQITRFLSEGGFTTILIAGGLAVEDQQPGIRDVPNIRYMIYFVGVQKKWDFLLLFLLNS
jgi:hypothetical protein